MQQPAKLWTVSVPRVRISVSPQNKSTNARLAGVFISLWFGFVIEMKKTGDIKQYAPELHVMNVISQKIILVSVRIGKNLSIFASAFNARGVAQPG